MTSFDAETDFKLIFIILLLLCSVLIMQYNSSKFYLFCMVKLTLAPLQRAYSYLNKLNLSLTNLREYIICLTKADWSKEMKQEHSNNY